MKKGLIQIIHHLAISVFVGISIYGVILYWGGETQEKISHTKSLLLGTGAIVCILVVVAVGGLLDRMAGAEEENAGSESGENGRP